MLGVTIHQILQYAGITIRRCYNTLGVTICQILQYYTQVFHYARCYNMLDARCYNMYQRSSGVPAVCITHEIYSGHDQ